ncbi:MAG: sigma-70 factor domain-containing protein [Limisphaerales bacterium]
MDEIFTKLRGLEIEIVDQAEVDNVKKPPTLKRKKRGAWTCSTIRCGCISSRWGQVALLTREQEVEISKRIEDAETEVTKIIYSLGFAAKGTYRPPPKKLLAEPPRERFDRVILEKTSADNRDGHLRAPAPAGGKRPRNGSKS